MPGSRGSLSGRHFAAVVFDMDGTLVDSTPAVVRSWLRWADEEDVDPSRLRGYHGIPASGIVTELLPADRWEAALARITAIELADTEGIGVLPGALEALTAVPPEQAAIATSCTRDLAWARIEATALPAPKVVVTVDDVERGKPSPDPFLEAARRLGADPAECLVVEDAPGGLTAARAAGCATLAVRTTTPDEELVADLAVDSLARVRFVVSGRFVRVEEASGPPPAPGAP